MIERMNKDQSLVQDIHFLESKIDRNKLLLKNMDLLVKLKNGTIDHKEAELAIMIWCYLEFCKRGHVGVYRCYFGNKYVIEFEPSQELWKIWGLHKNLLKGLTIGIWKDHNFYIAYCEVETIQQRFIPQLSEFCVKEDSH